MPKLKRQQILAPEKHILAIPDHYVCLTAKIAFGDLNKLVVKNTTGTKYAEPENIPCGTVVYMDKDGKLDAPDKSSKKPNAIIFNTINPADFDSSDTHINATVLVHGFVREDRLYEPSKGSHGFKITDFNNPLIHIIAK